MDQVLGGPAITIGLVAVVSGVVSVVLAIVFFGYRAIAGVKREVVELVTEFKKEVRVAMDEHRAAIADHRRESEGRVGAALQQIGALAARQDDLRAELPEKYLKRADFKDLVEPIITEMRFRFDQLDEKFALARRRPAGRRAKSAG